VLQEGIAKVLHFHWAIRRSKLCRNLSAGVDLALLELQRCGREAMTAAVDVLDKYGCMYMSSTTHWYRNRIDVLLTCSKCCAAACKPAGLTPAACTCMMSAATAAACCDAMLTQLVASGRVTDLDLSGKSSVRLLCVRHLPCVQRMRITMRRCMASRLREYVVEGWRSLF
jgi:hypothetical protein